MMEAISYSARATDKRVTCLRIYADPNGETHMQDIDVALMPKELFKDRPPLRLSDTLAASGCNICRVPSGMREVGWHNPLGRKLVIWLTGEVEFETSDGDIRRVAAGSVVLAEIQRARVTFPAILQKVSWSSTSTLPNLCAAPRGAIELLLLAPDHRTLTEHCLEQVG